MRNAWFSKITRVVRAREVSKYAREPDRIRARRANHETIEKWKLPKLSLALMAILFNVSYKYYTRTNFSCSDLGTPGRVFARENQVAQPRRIWGDFSKTLSYLSPILTWRPRRCWSRAPECRTRGNPAARTRERWWRTWLQTRQHLWRTDKEKENQ